MIKTLNAYDEIKDEIKANPLSVVVFGTRSCVVCKPLKEKIGKILEGHSHVFLGQVYIEDVAEARGEYQVFTAPIILVFVEGREAKRYSRAMDLNEFTRVVERYESLLFG